jgi:Putative DNA-binding domain
LEAILSLGKNIVITNDQFNDYLALKRETFSIEFKGTGCRKDNPLFGKIIRAAIGLSNRRNGGLIIVGVSDHSGMLSPIGLTDEQLSTWRYDDVASGIANYADPPISFDLDVYESNNMKFVVLDIHEFTDTPIICKKEYRDESDLNVPFNSRKVILRKGAFYIRSKHKIETVEATSSEEMEELFELAAEKRLQKFVALARSAPELSYLIQPPDVEQFKQQLDHTINQIPFKILEGGYWRVSVRPTKFNQERIEFARLFPLLQQTTVSRGGYDFPQLDLTHNFTRGLDFVSQNLDWFLFPEVWFFYQSGQLVDFSAIDNAQMAKQETKILSVKDVVYRLTEIFEFASHLVQSMEYAMDHAISIEILITGLEGRQLDRDYSQLGWMSSRVYTVEFKEFPFIQEFAPNELIGNAKELALQVAKRLFDRFGWELTLQLLRDVQATLR